MIFKTVFVLLCGAIAAALTELFYYAGLTWPQIAVVWVVAFCVSKTIGWASDRPQGGV